MASRSVKRSRQELSAACDDDKIQIRLAGGKGRAGAATAVQLEADALIVRSCSTCARGLPPDAHVWDLSGMAIDGHPVSRETVVQWLNCAYSRIHDQLFDKTAKLSNTASSLYQLLAFGDAVGSSRGVLGAALQQLADLMVVVPLQGMEVELYTDGSCYVFEEEGGVEGDDDDEDLLELCWVTPTDKDTAGDVFPRKKQQEIQKAVAAQTEPLLYMAHKLQLQPLIQRLQSFIASSCIDEGSLLHGVLELVFSERVLDAAIGSGSMSKEAWISGVLARPCSFVGGEFCHKKLEPLSLPPALRFKARVKEQDFLGCDKGSEVDVKLDLFNGSGGRLRLGDLSLPVQLLVGSSIACAEDLEQVMHGGSDNDA